jgi:hypothetical protein
MAAFSSCMLLWWWAIFVVRQAVHRRTKQLRTQNQTIDRTRTMLCLQQMNQPTD